MSVLTQHPSQRSRDTRVARWVLRAVGLLALLFAAFGVLGQSVYVWSIATDPECCSSEPFFPQAFAVLAAFSYLACAGYIVVGVKFLALRARWLPFFLTLSAVVLLESLIPGGLWLHPRFGSSIAAASGVGSMGTSAVVLTGYPLWGSALAWWATLRLRRAGPLQQSVSAQP